MKVTINNDSGFCFGVVYAIRLAEEELEKSNKLYCLGDIVHNDKEVSRLRNKGLIIIDHNELKQLRDCKVLIRAHGEPPETYRIALNNSIELIDATCPVVLKLQNNIRIGLEEMDAVNGQIVIYGKQGHAEVNGLVGQTLSKAIIVSDKSDLTKIDFTKPMRIYAQTTQSIEGFFEMVQVIKQKAKEVLGHKMNVLEFNTICTQVSHRAPDLKKFSKQHEVIVFVSSKESSNGLFLFNQCKEVNARSYFVSDVEEVKNLSLKGVETVGICGATSTPLWLMQKVADEISKFKSK